MKYFLIAFNGLKKKKGDAIALFFLIMFATVMMYIGVSIFSNLGKVLDETNTRNNGADVLMVSQVEPKDEIEKMISEYEGVKTLEIGNASYIGSVDYGRLEEKKEEMAFLMEPLNEKRTISAPEIVDCGNKEKENSIVLPYYLHVAKGYETGDIISLEIGEKTYECEVYGFIEDILFATPSNVSMYHVWMAEDMLEKMQAEQSAGVMSMPLYKVKLEEGYDSSVMEGEMIASVEKVANNFSECYTIIANYATMRFADLITANILTAILIVFALTILLITIVIISFSIQNAMERNLTNIGILEASGYTTGQLIACTMAESFIVAVAGIMAALLASPFLAEAVGNVVASSIGVRWMMGFEIVSAIITVVMVLLFVLLATYIVSKKYKKISILDALRGGVKTHNFRKNYIPLEKTHLPVHSALGIKGILNQKRKSVAICLITVVMTVACNTGFFLYQNFVLSNDNLMNLIGIERASAQITCSNVEEIEEAGKAISQLEEVANVKYYATGVVKIRHGQLEENIQTEFWTEMENFVTQILVEGRYPEYDNEILLSRVACEKLEVVIGDTVSVTSDGNTGEYLVVGVSEHISYLGKKAVMRMDGIQRINKSVRPVILMVYKNEDVVYTELEKAIYELYPEYEIADVENIILSASESIAAGMKAICLVFNICTLLVITIIMFLMIRIKLTQDKVRMGVDKALGFTTVQLITRVVMNYLPVVFVGTVFGSVVSYVSFNPLVSLCLGFCGIRSCNMARGIEFMVVTVVLITATALVASVIVSAKIRKIEPSKMIRE